MRAPLLLGAVLLAGGAAPHAALRPRLLGYYEDWIAAVHQEGGMPVCYAFTRALVHPEIVMTVTRRPHGHDTVAISLGYRPRDQGRAIVQAGSDRIGFYIAGRSAFARRGGAAVGALIAAPRAVGSFPGRAPDSHQTETFSMKGLQAAYVEAGKACPEP